jgi:polyketide cyclase/dehydrase/lipid transport protein
MRGQMRCHVSRSPEDVFDFLADLRNESRWNPRVVGIQQVTPGSVGTGTKFHGTYRGIGALDTVLHTCDRPSRIAFRSEGARMEIEGVFMLTEASDGTEYRPGCEPATAGSAQQDRALDGTAVPPPERCSRQAARGRTRSPIALTWFLLTLHVLDGRSSAVSPDSGVVGTPGSTAA